MPRLSRQTVGLSVLAVLLGLTLAACLSHWLPSVPNPARGVSNLGQAIQSWVASLNTPPPPDSVTTNQAQEDAKKAEAAKKAEEERVLAEAKTKPVEAKSADIERSATPPTPPVSQTSADAATKQKKEQEAAQVKAKAKAAADEKAQQARAAQAKAATAKVARAERVRRSTPRRADTTEESRPVVIKRYGILP